MPHIMMAMSEPVLVALIEIVPATGMLIYTIIAKILEIKLKNVPLPRTTIISTAGDHRHTVYVSLGKVLLHAGIVQLSAEIAGAILSYWASLFGLSFTDKYILIDFFIFVLIAYIFAFEWVAAKVEKVIRWKHLLYVALVVTILALISSLLFIMLIRQPITDAVNINNIIIICIRTFGGMAIAGFIANAMKHD